MGRADRTRDEHLLAALIKPESGSGRDDSPQRGLVNIS